VIGQKTQPRPIPPCPPEFGEEFVLGGWRHIEHIYGARTDLLLKWIEMSGGRALYLRRREHMKENGVRPFGRAGGNAVKVKGADTASWLDR
jgi:hypothetical protein